MKKDKRKELSKDIRKQKIMFGISLFAGIYLIYFGMRNEDWVYYCAVASAYIFTKAVNFGMKIYKNYKFIKSSK